MTDLVERLRAHSFATCAEAADELTRLREEVEALRADAERWRKALSAYERGVVMGHDGRTGEVDGYVSLFLAAIKEMKA